MEEISEKLPKRAAGSSAGDATDGTLHKMMKIIKETVEAESEKPLLDLVPQLFPPQEVHQLSQISPQPDKSSEMTENLDKNVPQEEKLQTNSTSDHVLNVEPQKVKESPPQADLLPQKAIESQEKLKLDVAEEKDEKGTNSMDVEMKEVKQPQEHSSQPEKSPEKLEENVKDANVNPTTIEEDNHVMDVESQEVGILPLEPPQLQKSLEKPTENVAQDKKFEWSTDSMDIRVFEMIAQHLEPKELLQFSLVSTEINQLVGKCESFKSKIKFKIFDFDGAGKRQSRLDLGKVMSSSVRSYKHVNIRAKQMKGDELELMLKNEWKTAVVSIVEVESSAQLVKYLGLLTPTLTSLTLTINGIRHVDSGLKLKFSSLKILKFAHCTSSALEPFVDEAINTTLKQLKIENVVQAPRSMKISRIYDNFINKLQSLVHLDLSSSAAEQLFVQDISSIVSFRLKELRVDGPPSATASRNIEEFIKSQGMLKEICLMSWTRTETPRIVWRYLSHIIVIQMGCKQPGVSFDTQLERLPATTMKVLALDYPNSSIPLEYLSPMLLGKNLETIRISAENIQPEVKKLLGQAADTVVINGEIVVEQGPGSPGSESSYSSDSDGSDEDSDSPDDRPTPAHDSIVISSDSD